MTQADIKNLYEKFNDLAVSVASLNSTLTATLPTLSTKEDLANVKSQITTDNAISIRQHTANCIKNQGIDKKLVVLIVSLGGALVTLSYALIRFI